MKQSLSFIILLLGILLIGTGLFFLTALLVGWNVFGWFSTKEAIFVYLIVAIVGLTLIIYWWRGKDE